MSKFLFDWVTSPDDRSGTRRLVMGPEKVVVGRVYWSPLDRTMEKPYAADILIPGWKIKRDKRWALEDEAKAVCEKAVITGLARMGVMEE